MELDGCPSAPLRRRPAFSDITMYCSVLPELSSMSTRTYFVGKALAGMFLEKTVAVTPIRAAQQRDRTVSRKIEHAAGGLRIVSSDIALGAACVGKDHAVGAAKRATPPEFGRLVRRFRPASPSFTMDGLLVLAQAFEHAMPDDTLIRQFGILDLDDEVRRHPVGRARDIGRHIVEGAGLAAARSSASSRACPDPPGRGPPPTRPRYRSSPSSRDPTSSEANGRPLACDGDQPPTMNSWRLVALILSHLPLRVPL